MTTAAETKVLTKDTTLRIITRLAWEILEQHYEKPCIRLLAINGNGEKLAHRLAQELALIQAPATSVHTIVIDKSNAANAVVEVLPALSSLKSAGVILVDDVLNTGKTLLYSLVPLLKLEPDALHIAVLVDRGHHQFPLGADFIGYRLATTLQEHIRVSFEEEDFGVYLS